MIKPLLNKAIGIIKMKKDSECKKTNFYTDDLLKDCKHLVKVGKFTYGKPEILHWGENAKLKIGKYCSIANDVVVFLGGNHRVHAVTTYPFEVFHEWAGKDKIEIKEYALSKGDVVIGNDVWIGHGATILSGIKIGDGAIIGTRAVVTHNVLPYSIVAGNPAREIKKRFDDVTVEKLLKLKWWDWPEAKIKKHIKELCSEDIQKVFDLK
jgi:acetyltransferase-like isoleucine patch superfamily enzyme